MSRRPMTSHALTASHLKHAATRSEPQRTRSQYRGPITLFIVGALVLILGLFIFGLAVAEAIRPACPSYGPCASQTNGSQLGPIGLTLLATGAVVVVVASYWGVWRTRRRGGDLAIATAVLVAAALALVLLRR